MGRLVRDPRLKRPPIRVAGLMGGCSEIRDSKPHSSRGVDGLVCVIRDSKPHLSRGVVGEVVLRSATQTTTHLSRGISYSYFFAQGQGLGRKGVPSPALPATPLQREVAVSRSRSVREDTEDEEPEGEER